MSTIHIGLNRDQTDKFYTNPSVVKICMEYIRTILVIKREDIIIEPSAGNGAFVSEIEKISNHTFFYDIAPEHPKVYQADFLEVDLDILRDFVDCENRRKIHFIGNPPFGRQSCLAFLFIKKCVKYADSISFILPKSFRKQSMQRYFPKCFHLVFEADLLENAFLVNGKVHDVPCVFQIWEKKNVERDVLAHLEPFGFEFVKRDGEQIPDISFRRVGVNAGMIDTEWREKSVQSHYFIRFTNGVDLLENIARVQHAEFLFNNTVGPKSISKQELIREWNRCLVVEI
jgi:hypothetical protein